ncbi:hypothetical protein CRENBAI_020385 [Crenichthys baileyi]|uniref:Cortactin-binding protein-2 N-terminal domain-containing protein n=1 Tax=Crenichthys baileyi TaxID=28760 RepID=A0AAV9SNX7_9TELE
MVGFLGTGMMVDRLKQEGTSHFSSDLLKIRAQHRDEFVQDRYGQYDLSDPFLALQRDDEVAERQNALRQPQAHPHGRAVGPNPLAVLKLVMTHCKRMQERMMGQLAAAESRHRRMIADLEQEKQRYAQESARGADYIFALKTERDKLLQQLEVEHATVQRLEKEQTQVVSTVKQSLSQEQQLSSSLTLELQKASSQAQEEAQKVSQLHMLLQEETCALEKLQQVLEYEKSRVAHMEARSEKQIAEFDAEKEQMKTRLKTEEERVRELEKQVKELRKRLAELQESKTEVKEAVTEVKESEGKMVSSSAQTEPDGKITPKSSTVPKVNGLQSHKETEPLTHEVKGPENGVDNGGGTLLHSPIHPFPHPHSPSSTASSSLSSSLFFGGDLSPTTSSTPPPTDHSTAKQQARNTVTQVLSRFTSQQAGVKAAPINNSPFGTDYRNLAASPTGGRSPSSGPLSPGFRSPLTPRSEKTYPPPIPPKRPGMSPTPGSPNHSARTSLFPELTGNCGDSSSGQEGAKESDLVLS